MKRYFIYSVLCLSMMAGTALFSSCSDDDDEGKLDPGSPEYITQSKATEKALTLYQLLGTLAPTDSLPDNWETTTYEPMIGDALDGANPYVRTLAVSGMDEAVAIYNAMTGRELKADAQSDTWSYEGLGSLSFQAAGTAELTATIQCALSQMPHLTTLRLVPASALGENADFKPYYHTGDVIRASDGSFWICARSANAAAGKKDSHWFSFQLNEEENYKVYKKTEKRRKTTMPDDLGDNTTQMKYLMQLLSLMADPTIYADMIQHEMRNGLGDLGNAYKEADIRKMAAGWAARVWNNPDAKVIPVGKEYFMGNHEITLLYKGHSSSFFSSIVKLYAADYSGSGHSNATLYMEQWDMDEGRFFDVHNLVNTGRRGKNEVGPHEALVVRYKTATQLAGKSWRLDPEKPIPGATDIWLYKDGNVSKFRTGDILRSNTDNVAYFCVHPSLWEGSLEQALFVSCDPKAIKFPNEEKKTWYNGLTLPDAVRSMYVFNYLLKFPSKYAKTVDFIAAQTGLDLKAMFDNRLVDGGRKYPCSSIAYLSGSDYMAVCRSIFEQEYSDERDGFAVDFYQYYYTPQGENTWKEMDLVDASRQDIIDKYAKDKWSAYPFEDKTLGNCMTKADTPYDVDSYVKAMKDSRTRKTNIFNERVIVLGCIKVDDYGVAPDGYTLVRNTDPYWTDNNVTEIISRWAKERNDVNHVRMNGTEYKAN